VRILQVLPELELGGVETFVVLLSKELKKLGHDVVVVSSGGRLVDELKEYGVGHIKLPVSSKNPVTIWYSAFLLSKILKGLHVDVIHAHSRVPDWVAYFVSLFTRVPFVVSAHAFYTPHWGSKIVAKADRVICDSVSVGEYAVERLGVSRDKIRVVYNGIDVKRFEDVKPPFSNPPYSIGTVGRLAPSKGQKVLIEAFARLLKEGLDVRLVIAGDGPLMDELVSLSESLGVSGYVEFLGFRSDIPDVLSQIDLFVHPSLIPEPLSMALIEAMAASRPVVASGVGGFREVIVDGKTGYLVKPASVDELADAMRKIVINPESGIEMGENGLKRVRELFSSDVMATKMLEVYGEFEGANSEV